MEFRDLKAQYYKYQQEIEDSIKRVCIDANYISGYQVKELEQQLAEYVGVKYCVTCANGTDALQLALMAWGIGKGDAVFVPDFTFFASGEAPALIGATPVFVDVNSETYNIDIDFLEMSIIQVIEEGKLIPKVIVAVDLFGLPADYIRIREIARKYDLYILEDGAQGFGGSIQGKKACSFGDISTTSFFPAKPLGCYGDGGAIFTDNEEWALKIRSLCIHGKGSTKYDNIRIGMNSRLDTIQAAILMIKLKAFKEQELEKVNEIANRYTQELEGYIKVPNVKEPFYSSWAQYTIQFKSNQEREEAKERFKKMQVPFAVYYEKPMHEQGAFQEEWKTTPCNNSMILSKTVLSIPIHPYMSDEDIMLVVKAIKEK